MKKLFSLLLLCLLLLFFACDPDNTEKPVVVARPTLGNDGVNEGKEYGWNAGNLGGLTETITGNVSSAQYFYAQGLDAGWNAGNSLDVPNDETAWGNPRLNQDLFNGVAEQGFRIVRIPITWGSNIGPSPDYTVNENILNRVAEVVGYAHAAGLAAIINTHHDSWSLTTALTDNSITERFTAFWGQVADKFKGYGAWLIFEPLNESRSGNSWNEAPNPLMYDVINQWNQDFVDTVRASGGNNEHRYLMVKGYAAKRLLVMAHTEVPADSSPGKLILDFHYYDPEGLCLNGETTVWSVAGNGRRIGYDFEAFNNQFASEGLPVIIGESGVSYQGDRTGADAEKANASRTAYLEHMGRTARVYGITPILWDNGVQNGTEETGPRNKENFGLFNRNTGAANSEISKAAIDAFLKGIRTDE